MAEEYPRNLTELEADFSTDVACRAYLARLRWPTGFTCPRCGSAKAWPVRDLWECSGCGCQTSVTAGTIFQDTRTPLQVWFRAMWWVTTQKNGASALGLQRVLGLKKYETAWTWLHKFRRAMVRPGRDLLAGDLCDDLQVICNFFSPKHSCAVGADRDLHSDMGEVRIAMAQRRLDIFRIGHVGCHQGHDQAAMSRTQAPQMQVGYARAQFALKRRAYLA